MLFNDIVILVENKTALQINNELQALYRDYMTRRLKLREKFYLDDRNLHIDYENKLSDYKKRHGIIL
ncbi:hypothetical protein AGMMS50255_2740 [Spirochaetia bacterium]|nr:hypothetical protein AGMMS50255_2740 [Spirochaetia bacterium]